MNILRSFFVAMLVLFLFGCSNSDGKVTTNDNPITRADKQRQLVIVETRAASYGVFPDVKDTEILKDNTFLEALIAEKANGSAFGVRADGIVFTNVHVIEKTNFCTVEDPRESDFFRREKEENGDVHCLLLKANSSKAYRAKVIKLDKENDIATLQIEGEMGAFPFLRLAAMGNFAEGAEVLTIGAPLGNTNFMTPGYISNVNFVMPGQEGAKKSARKLQFSAPVLPGNSGGALVSFATGEVVGQVVAIYMMNGIPTQMSYANPVDFLRENLQSIPTK